MLIIDIKWSSLSNRAIVGIRNKQLLYIVSPIDIQSKKISLLAEITFNHCPHAIIDTLHYFTLSQPIVAEPGYKYVFTCADTALLNQWSYHNNYYGVSESEPLQISWTNLNGRGQLFQSPEMASYTFNHGTEANLVILQKTIQTNNCYATEYLYLQHSSPLILHAGDDVWLKDSMARNANTNIRFPPDYQGDPISTLYRWSHNGFGQMLQSNRNGFIYRAAPEDYNREYITVTLCTQFCETIIRDSFRIYIHPNGMIQPSLPRTFERGSSLTLSINPLLPILIEGCALYGDQHVFIQNIPLNQPTTVVLQDSLLQEGVLYIQYVIKEKNGAASVLEDSIIANDYQVPIQTTTLQKISLGIIPSHLKTILVYPNPAKTSVHCQLPSSYSNTQWFICNELGVIVMTSTSSPNHISIEHLPDGCYFFEVIHHEEVLRTKFIKQ